MIDPSVLLLVMVLAGLVATPMLLKRRRAGAPDSVRIVGRTALHRNAVVAVIAVGDRRMLVGGGDHGIQLLAMLDDATAPTGTGDVGSAHSLLTTTTENSTDLPGRTDASGTPPTTLPPSGILRIPASWQGGARVYTEGPGTGLVDRLRGMTVRTPMQGRPLRVPFRR